MPLTNTAIRGVKPGSKPRKLFDGGGLFLLINPSGSKLWRMKYRFGGTERLISFGAYPQIGLKEARELRSEARKVLARGVDPVQHRLAQKNAQHALSENSFEKIAREWWAIRSQGLDPKHAKVQLRRLETYAFPFIGRRPIAEINAPEVLKILRKIEARGTIETAHRVKSICGQVFRYAVATGRAERDPTGDLRDALAPKKESHFAALTEPPEVAGLLRAIDSYQGSLVVRCALRLAPLVFVRPGELRCAKWADVDFDAAEWRFTASKTKTPHIVPLARQAVAILREVQALTGNGPYVFPSARSEQRPMSSNTVLAAMRTLGFSKERMTGNGFRTMARTMLQDQLGYHYELIDHQLAHRVPDVHGRAYNRTKNLPQRREMMQRWADYLEGLKAGAQVIPFRQLGGGR